MYLSGGSTKWQHLLTLAWLHMLCVHIIQNDISKITIGQEMQRIVTRCLEMLFSDTVSNTGLQMECNYLVAIRTTENQLLALREEWAVYIELVAFQGFLIIFLMVSFQQLLR
jgi:hypothetical protein